jgi:2-keto-3-deoxy-L-rhamnonate aldolase RhmA
MKTPAIPIICIDRKKLRTMRTNHVKEKLKRGEPTLGAWLNIPNTTTARIMAHLGFDWLLIDMEHSAHNPALMADMVATIADAGTSAPFVRVPFNEVEWFKWALDAGAWGIIVPMVNTREEAERAVSWSKYPPEGTRSIGGQLAQYAFGTTDRAIYAQAANDEIMVIVQIESATALQNLDEILSVPGLDVAFVGPNDLHASIGLVPSTEGAEPEFMAELERVKATAQKYRVASGIMSSSGPATLERLRQNFQMITVTTDLSSMIASAKHELRIAREE